jgi:ribonuclease HII
MLHKKNILLENNLEVGLDEAGRGPLIGRVYAGCVAWPDNNFTLNELKYIKDSKKLSPIKRENALKWIQKNIPYWGVGFADEKEIDAINILNATKLAMERAIIELKNKLNSNLIITNLIIDGTGWNNKFAPYIVDSIIKGDNLYYSIAAASIIAKTYHDNYIHDLCKLDPLLDTYYFLSKNMGYPTKDHRTGLIKYGPSIYHRISFNGVKKI